MSKLNLKFVWKCNSQNYLEKEGFFHYLILRHFKAVVIENAVLCGNRQIGGTEQRLEIDPYIVIGSLIKEQRQKKR